MSMGLTRFYFWESEMHGSIKWQVNTVLNTIREIGQSRDAAKQKIEYSDPHELAQKTGIFSYKTLDTYRNIARDIIQFTRQNFSQKNIEKLTPEHISAFFQSKIESGKSYNTIKTYSAAANKLATALNAYQTARGKPARFDFSAATAAALSAAKTKIGIKEQSRALENPAAVIAAIQKADFRIIANFQLASGLRVHELNHIRPDQLVTTASGGMVTVEQGKGGKDRVVSVPDAKAFENFKKLINKKKETTGRYAGKYIFDKKAYTAAVTAAAKQAGEHPTAFGTHTLRWNFAQQLLNKEQIENDKTFREAQQATSESLGHNRIYITSHYLN